MKSPPRGVNFRLYCVTARRLLAGAGLAQRLAVLCEHGLKGLQVREKDLGEEELRRLVSSVRGVLERYAVQWLVNSRSGIARECGATGVHLTGEGDVGACRGELGPHYLIGKSVHGTAEAVSACGAGADFLVFGPVFPTASKGGDVPVRGLDALKEVCAHASLPVFAIGGMTPERARKCRGAGAHGVAAMSALMEDRDPESLLASYEDSLGSL